MIKTLIDFNISEKNGCRVMLYQQMKMIVLDFVKSYFSCIRIMGNCSLGENDG